MMDMHQPGAEYENLVSELRQQATQLRLDAGALQTRAEVLDDIRFRLTTAIDRERRKAEAIEREQQQEAANAVRASE